jgi:hypothetical protein
MTTHQRERYLLNQICLVLEQNVAQKSSLFVLQLNVSKIKHPFITPNNKDFFKICYQFVVDCQVFFQIAISKFLQLICRIFLHLI